MGIFNRGRKEKEKDEDYTKDVARTEVEARGRGEPVTFDADLQARIYTLIDPNFLDQISKDKVRSSVYPAYSFLNRTSRINEKDRTLILLNYEYLEILITAIMKDPKPRQDYIDWIKSVAYTIFVQFMANDSLKGWKGHLLTESTRVVRAQLEKVKKKGGFP